MNDRFGRAFATLVREVFPNYSFLSIYRYRVVRMNSGDNRVCLQPVAASLGLPDLLPVSIMPGVPGAKPELAEGSTVLVSFIEGDPKQPIVTHFASPDSGDFLPVSIALNASASVLIGDSPGMPVARMTDTVQVGPFVGAISSGSLKVRSS